MREANQIHLKYVDDLTVAESLILKDSLTQVPVSERPQPDPYHARTGHAIIPEKSKVFQPLDLLIPNERQIRSIVGGLETSLGTTLWEALTGHLHRASCSPHQRS